MTMNRFKTLLLLFLLLAGSLCQPVAGRIVITPDHADWLYKPGEKAKFRVSVLKNSVPVNQVKISYECGPEMMTPVKAESVVLPDGQYLIDGGTLKEPGFLRCKVSATVDGYQYENLSTAAFAPEKIVPTAVMPADFRQFWDEAKTEAAKIPMDARLTLLPERARKRPMCTMSISRILESGRGCTESCAFPKNRALIPPSSGFPGLVSGDIPEM